MRDLKAIWKDCENIESAKEPAYRKVNEEPILMYRDIGDTLVCSLKMQNALSQNILM